MAIAARNVSFSVVGEKRPSLRAQRSEIKYKTILEAAKKTFAKKGFYTAKVIDVAQEANVASGTIYLYFKNKDDIIVKLFDDVFENITAQIWSEIKDVRDAREQLALFCAGYIEIVSADKYLADLIHIEMNPAKKYVSRYADKHFRHMLGMLEEIIEKGMDDGVFDTNILAGLSARMIYSSLNEACLQIIAASGKNTQTVADSVSAMFLRGLGAIGVHDGDVLVAAGC